MTELHSVAGLAAIQRSVARAERRLRVVCALAWSVKSLAAGFFLAALVLGFRKTSLLPELATRLALGVCVMQGLVVAVVGFAWPLPRAAGAFCLERFFGLSGRFSSALAFADLPPEAQTPFMHAAIADAAAHLAAVDVRAAVPFRFPREGWGLTLSGAVAVAVITLFEVHSPTFRGHPGAATPSLHAVAVPNDELDAAREVLRAIEPQARSDEARTALTAFNQLVDDLASKRLDTTEAFRRMAKLEESLKQDPRADARSLDEVLARVGSELTKSEWTRAAGEALLRHDVSSAENAMRELAKKVRTNGSQAPPKALEAMRDALKAAAQVAAKRRQTLEKRREELTRDLLRAKEKAETEDDKQLLRTKERELERLDRESKEPKKNDLELERLDRELESDLEKAAEDLMRDMNLAADDVEHAAEDLNRMAAQAMTNEVKKQLLQKLQELREQMRKASQTSKASAGSASRENEKKFQRRARGMTAASEGEGESAERERGQKDSRGAKNDGGATEQDSRAGESITFGPNGESALVIRGSTSKSTAGAQKQGAAERGGGSDKNERGAASRGHKSVSENNAAVRTGTEDTQVQGVDTGQGVRRSEVILGAAERGFVSRDYSTVFREYQTVAEEALAKDDVPGGYRSYVRRYFQLIRPRSETPPATTPLAAP